YPTELVGQPRGDVSRGHRVAEVAPPGEPEGQQVDLLVGEPRGEPEPVGDQEGRRDDQDRSRPSNEDPTNLRFVSPLGSGRGGGGWRGPHPKGVTATRDRPTTTGGWAARRRARTASPMAARRASARLAHPSTTPNAPRWTADTRMPAAV